MRLVLASNNHVGKTLAHPIYNSKGIILIPARKELTSSIIERIKNSGIAYIYVEESLSEHVLVELVFGDVVRKRLLEDLKTLYTNVQKKKIIDEKLLHQIVKEILINIKVGENAIFHKDTAVTDALSYTAMHCLEVAVLCVTACRNKMLGYNSIEKMVYTALLHDVGRLVSKDEDHRKTSFELIKSTTNLSPVIYTPILHMKEKIDGSGPEKLKGEAIHEHAQILQIANNYSNLINTNMSPSEAMEKLQADARTKFDISLFRKSVEVFYCYPNGLMVELTNGKSGLVSKQNQGFPSRPVVISKTGETIDLLMQPTIFIKHILE